MKENRNCISVFDSLWFGLKPGGDNKFVFVQDKTIDLSHCQPPILKQAS